MADNSAIEWTDATWNPITGCSVVSPGCANCYAMKLAGGRLRRHPSRAGLTDDSRAGPVWNGQVRLNESWLDQPLRWTRPRRIFVCAHGDLFHENVPDAWIATTYAVMVAAVHLRGHTFQVLTKRAARARALLSSDDFWDQVNAEASTHVMDAVDPLDRRRDDARATLDDYGPDNPPPGIWLGVSAEDQARAEERVPLLLKTPAAVRFLSAEPLLGQIDLTTLDLDGDSTMDALNPYTWDEAWAEWRDASDGSPDEALESFLEWFGLGERRTGPMHPTLDWVIVGGESGHGARPMHPDWARQIRDACTAAGAPFFFKQWGSHRWAERIEGDPSTLTPYRAGKLASGHDRLDGGVHHAMPGRAA